MKRIKIYSQKINCQKYWTIVEFWSLWYILSGDEQEKRRTKGPNFRRRFLFAGDEDTENVSKATEFCSDMAP